MRWCHSAAITGLESQARNLAVAFSSACGWPSMAHSAEPLTNGRPPVLVTWS
ncbi:Uncharacterised protein [Bordetella pertussis]|nr:Uncharacterised protein [Bordetella pertussis]